MPGANTPNRGLPQIVGGDSPDVVRDLNALALALDNEYRYLAEATVLDVGQVGQVRAGRALTVADFTTLLGLSQPVGLWNLTDLTNLGSGGALVNKGAVPFAPGILGLAGGAAQFAGSTAQVLYIADTGAADPFRVRSGSWGCWFRTAKRGTYQGLMAKQGPDTNTGNNFNLQVSSANVVVFGGSTGGTAATAWNFAGVTDVCDDRWHHVVVTFDGTVAKMYIDGMLDAFVGAMGALFATSAEPLNIGGQDGDAGTATVNPFYGRIDEAFVTLDVLSDDQVRLIYAAKIAHGLVNSVAAPLAPRKTQLSVRRRKRGPLLVAADFPAQPARLHNLDGIAAPAKYADLGANGVALAGVGAGVGNKLDNPGPDGARGGAHEFSGGDNAASTDAGLPTALAARSFGAWFKTTNSGGTIISWGTTVATNDVRLDLNSSLLRGLSAGAVINGPAASDGAWHFAVEVDDNAAADGVKRKLYLDGKLVGTDTSMNAIALGGANKFRVGADVAGAQPFSGHIARAFVYAGALTGDQIRALYAKGSQAIPLTPKDGSDHIEAIDATNLYVIHDALSSPDQVDYSVAA
jgi:hypothetical protein